MTEWKTLKEVAEVLKISKDLVKYHRKHLTENQLKKHDGVYYVSESGVEEIRSRLTKTKYDTSFEETVLKRLGELKHQQDLIYEFVLQMIDVPK